MRDGEQYPVLRMPLARLDYRWAPDGREPHLAYLIEQHRQLVRLLRGQPGELLPQEAHRLESVLPVFEDVAARRVVERGWFGTGLENPLICWRAAPGRYLVLHGCQRLTVCRALLIDPVPVRISREWDFTRVLLAHPQRTVVPLSAASGSNGA